MSDNSERNHPRNLQGLLRLAAETTSSSRDDQQQPNFETISDERRQWLNDVLLSMTTDHVSVMNENIKIILDGIANRKNKTNVEDEEDISQQEDALDNIVELVDNLDNANDFHKIGGFNIILPLLETSGPEYAGLRWRISNLLAVLVQNNPYCQNAALNENNGGIINLLLALMDSDSNATVKVKCVHALSCLTRGNSEAQDQFQKAEGFSFLVKAIQSDIEKLKIKSCFMLTAYCEDNPSVKENLYKMGYVELMANLLHREQSSVDEHLLSALLSFVTDHEPSIRECLRPELDLKRILIQKVETLKDKEEFIEQVEYSQKLLEKCFPNVEFDGTER